MFVHLLGRAGEILDLDATEAVVGVEFFVTCTVRDWEEDVRLGIPNKIYLDEYREDTLNTIYCACFCAHSPQMH